MEANTYTRTKRQGSKGWSGEKHMPPGQRGWVDGPLGFAGGYVTFVPKVLKKCNQMSTWKQMHEVVIQFGAISHKLPYSCSHIFYKAQFPHALSAFTSVMSKNEHHPRTS